MSVVPLKPTCQLFIVPPVAQMLHTSATRDFAEINAVYNGVNKDFMKNFDTQSSLVDGLINPRLILGQSASISQNIYKIFGQLPDDLRVTEGHITDRNSIGLKYEAKYFGIGEIRKALYAGNVPQIVAGLSTFIKAITDKQNNPILTNVGLKKSQTDNYIAVKDSLENLYQSRVTVNNEKNALVEDNHEVINALWNDMVYLCDKGKRVFKSADPSKVPQYTMSQLIAKVKRDLALNDVHGLITADGKPLGKVSIELQPVDRGYRRVGKTKATGFYQIDGIVPGKYILTLTAKGQPPLSTEITINQGEKLMQNFDMVKV